MKEQVPQSYLFTIVALLSLWLIVLIIGHRNSEAVLNRSVPKGLKIATVAHRGCSGYAPECTISSYRTGIRMNSDYMEIDLQLTKDGEIIVMHDRTVDRTTNGTGPVNHKTLAEIKALDAGTWFNVKHPGYAREHYVNEKVPTLREIFEAFGNSTRYMLETKALDDSPGLEEKMWAMVEEFGLIDRVAVQSFSKESLMKIRSWNKDVLLFQLFWYRKPAHISQAKLKEISGYANGIGANFLRINESYVRKVKQAGLLMYPYTVNHEANMKKAVKWGVDGIHTDYPDRFIRIMNDL
jgi:glycerophosphoryl diester phosphodiesterase